MLDRRAFIAAGGSSLALLGVNSPLLAQGATVARRSVRGMTANDPDLAAMSRAVAAMKALPRSDPRNWTRFADIHRSFCPHGNWYFLPWHRAYLASFEEIVRELSGKADFALPYWDWTADRAFPAAFSAGDRSSNPLLHPRPGVANGLQLADDMVGPQVISRVLQSPDFEAFGSSRPQGQDSAAPRWQRRAGSRTELEFNPHDGVHQSIGGSMAVVDLASRDPIFFLHHANVDRLWSNWNARGNANSTEAIWRNFAFSRNFLAGDGSPWDVRVGELNSTPALGYRYDSDDIPFAAEVAMSVGDPVTEKLRAYRQALAGGLLGSTPGVRRIDIASLGSVYVASTDNSLVGSRDKPLAVNVPLHGSLGDILGHAARLGPPSGEANDRRNRRHVFAFMHDVELPLDPTTRVQTFVNCAGLTPQTRIDDQSYATGVSFFGSEHSRHGAPADAGGASLCVDLSQPLARMGQPRGPRTDRLTVQLLPRCESNEAHVSNIRPRRVEVVIL
jgi:tyrosinase